MTWLEIRVNLNQFECRAVLFLRFFACRDSKFIPGYRTGMSDTRCPEPADP